MAPDLNSLPPSRSVSSSPQQSRPMQASPTTPSMQENSSPRIPSSLAATASMNATNRSRRSSSTLQNRGSTQIERMPSDRRRSQVAMSLSLNDPAIPSPGELASSDHRASIGHSFSAASPFSLGGRGTIATGDPHHQRQPSLGEIHNELEQEQEAQVNRMLQMIRAQQQQLENLQRNQQDGDQRRSSVQSNTAAGAAVVDEPTPGSERSFSFQRSSNLPHHPASANRSPALRPLPNQEGQNPTNDHWPPSPLDTVRRNSLRDEHAYYQAETANLTRENQMLKLRVRELEKQVGEMSAKPASSASPTSNLSTNSPMGTQNEGVAARKI